MGDPIKASPQMNQLIFVFDAVPVPVREHKIMSYYVRDFFDKYFNGKPSELLDGTARYPEITAERFNGLSLLNSSADKSFRLL